MTNTIPKADITKTRDFENFIRGMICQGGITQKNAALALGYLKNQQNFLNKLHRGTFRSLEERELAGLLGYRVTWVRENHTPLNDEKLDTFIRNQQDKLVFLLNDFKPLQNTLKQLQRKNTDPVMEIFLSPAEQRDLSSYWVCLGKIKEIWYSIQSFLSLRYPEALAFSRREALIRDVYQKTSIHLERDIEQISFF